MAIIEHIDDKGYPSFFYLNIHGGGWESDLMKIIVDKIYPEKIERVLHKAGWHSSETEILFVKNNITYSIYMDEMDGINFYPISDNFNLEIAREFAKIIDVESEKMKSRN